ncbi:MAG: endonuclease [Clostridia bacterium]|nr:endonuclease [Clostridia bacterium]
MKHFKERFTSMLLILILLAGLIVPVHASETRAVATYSTEYNSGERGEVCTTLDGTSAGSYYQGYGYDDLSALSESALFDALQSLMRSTHTTISSYDDCHYMADRTDCENENGSVLLLYTSYVATMSQWNGWNREHVWPQSLGGNTTSGGGADLHHIRPSDAGVNSSRGNKKYGEAGSNATEKYGSNPATGYLGGTYSSTYFEPRDEVKGDVARICLYVYVRWNSDWGADSITDVFQSVDVLLEWCELDPVDTWEMGRNEVVGSIQGNRNVFIDYPEYAWLLFGKDVPDSMTTPSGEAAGDTSDGGSSDGSSSDGSSSGGVTEPDSGTTTVTSATLSFASKDQRTSFSTTAQVWEQNGITFTNQKASSTNSVADYVNPVRLYKSSSITVAGEKNIEKIEFNCASESYASTLASSIGSEATVNGTTVTVLPTTPAESYSVSALSAQVRLNSLTVYYEESAPACTHTSTTTLKQSATCTDAGTLTVTCDDCGETVSSTTLEPLGHDLIDGVCARCGYAESAPSAPAAGGWTLVTDASELAAGDRIILTAKTFVAGSIGNSIMASVDGLVTSENAVTTLPDGAVVLTLGGTAGAFTLANDQGQLLGATAVKKLAWNQGTTTWSISISNGNATVQSTTSSYGRFLYNVNSPRFTTYTSSTNTSMLLPQIYKYVESSAEDEAPKITGASMTVGSTLAMNYYVSGYEEDVDYTMVFTVNGKESARVMGVEANGYLVFTFTNIPPQCMGDNISAALYSGENELPVAVKEEYSVKAYAASLMAKYSDNEELMDLLADMLRYGAAAQLYRGYKTDALVTNGLNPDAYGSDALPTEEDNVRSLQVSDSTAQSAHGFTAVGVRFDYDNKIYVKFKTDDLSAVSLTVNGTVVTGLTDRVVSAGDGVYVFYTDGILATAFDRTYTFALSVNGTPLQTLTYSVNTYAYVKCDDTATEDASTLSPLAELVRALYRYGLSAKAYVG